MTGSARVRARCPRHAFPPANINLSLRNEHRGVGVVMQINDPALLSNLLHHFHRKGALFELPLSTYQATLLVVN
jgi:hypothetical protein